MLNENSLGLFAAKQSRNKSIAWHLRWHVRTRTDISLRPSGLVRPRTDAAKCICKNKDRFQVADSWIGKIIQGLIQEQVYTQIVIWPLFKS